MELINRIRQNQNCGMDTKDAVNAAVGSCIADGIMKDFLLRHKAEVMNVCITEFDEKVFIEGIREEGREKGLRALIYSLRDFLPDFESVYKAIIKNAEYSSLSREDVRKYY